MSYQAENGTPVVYRPNVCRQEPGTHVHYYIVPTKDPRFITNLELLRTLGRRLSRSTAGEIVTRIREEQELGHNLAYYDIDYMLEEDRPLYEICHKTEDDSPITDWYKFLFITPPPIPPNPPVGNPQVAHIKHNQIIGS